MNRKYDVITIDKDLAVVVDKENKPVIGEYSYLIFNESPKNNELYKITPTTLNEGLKVIATIGKQVEGLPLVVLPEEDIETAARRFAEKYKQIIEDAVVDGYVTGYRAAQQKGRYSEEDMRKAIDMARMGIDEEPFELEGIFGLTEVCTHNMDFLHTPDQILQSLQPKRFPVAVEFGEWQLTHLKTYDIETITPVKVYYL